MFKKLAKTGLLLTIKESYLLAKNTYGLGVHPYKTLKSISREKDRSQELLILGWPIYVLILGAGVVWTGRRLLATSEEWGWGAKSMGIIFLLLSIFLGVYLMFWGMRVWREK
ncbi:MAG: hypothetical protein NTZ93_04310 [Candidatus Beckwithbacteria bacterium]|nr:hypothetical protein [Candidatus Beckwithbacteria bacterium]